ncbi:hypothetical protein ACR6C2_22010 [Streptomyces sp. INA 01156]
MLAVDTARVLDDLLPVDGDRAGSRTSRPSDSFTGPGATDTMVPTLSWVLVRVRLSDFFHGSVTCSKWFVSRL